MVGRAWLVTVKLPRRADHRPQQKVTGPCPVSEKTCTDVTGQHHTFLTTGQTSEEVRLWAEEAWGHVTRIEEV